MEIKNSSDIYEDSGLDPLFREMNLSEAFLNKDYGNNSVKIFFVINCLIKHLKARPPRFSKKENVLYWDIMLDYEVLKNSSLNKKMNILACCIINSFDVLDKYKKLGLNKDAIKEDTNKYFIQLGWLKPDGQIKKPK